MATYRTRDGDMLDASKIDQSKFHYKKNHESIR